MIMMPVAVTATVTIAFTANFKSTAIGATSALSVRRSSLEGIRNVVGDQRVERRVFDHERPVHDVIGDDGCRRAMKIERKSSSGNEISAHQFAAVSDVGSKRAAHMRNDGN